MLYTSGAQIPQALSLLEKAIALDADYGPALALAAICCFRVCADGTSESPETDRLKGMDFGHRALQTARDDPGALANAAFALGWFGEDIGSMIAVIDRALRLNPSHARGWYISGTLRLFAGDPNVAESTSGDRAASQPARAARYGQPSYRHGTPGLPTL